MRTQIVSREWIAAYPDIFERIPRNQRPDQTKTMPRITQIAAPRSLWENGLADAFDDKTSGSVVSEFAMVTDGTDF